MPMWRLIASHLYRPARETEATYSSSPFLKESFKFESNVEQIFEKNIYDPLVEGILSRARKVKVIQTGSIHAYLAYIFGTLVILFIYMIAGGS